MIYYVIALWIFVALAALAPLLLAAWRTRRLWQKPGMAYILAILLGAALDNGLSAFVALGALPRVTPEVHVTYVTLLLTVGRLSTTLPAIAFALYMLGLFGGDTEKLP